MDRENAVRVTTKLLQALQSGQIHFEEPLEEEEILFAIGQLASVLSASRIDDWLTAKGFKDLLVKTPGLDLARRVAGRMGDLELPLDLLHWLATIEIWTIRDLFEEAGLPCPEELR